MDGTTVQHERHAALKCGRDDSVSPCRVIQAIAIILTAFERFCRRLRSRGVIEGSSDDSPLMHRAIEPCDNGGNHLANAALGAYKSSVDIWPDHRAVSPLL
jgi:hypothetical protein